MPFATSALHLHRGLSMNTPEVYVLLLNRMHTETLTGALTVEKKRGDNP